MGQASSKRGSLRGNSPRIVQSLPLGQESKLERCLAAPVRLDPEIWVLLARCCRRLYREAARKLQFECQRLTLPQMPGAIASPAVTRLMQALNASRPRT